MSDRNSLFCECRVIITLWTINKLPIWLHFVSFKYYVPKLEIHSSKSCCFPCIQPRALQLLMIRTWHFS